MVIEVTEYKEYVEKAVLVGIQLETANEKDYELSFEELAELAKACNMEVAARVCQKLDAPNKALYIGPGKLEEVKNIKEMVKGDIVIFDNTLSPTQIRNIQKILECPVMDRTGLILEIFESRAKSREARLQVEVAKLQYMLPRLVGLHEALSRQGGGGGSRANKGAGEKKLELDRRKLEHRLTEFKRELEEVKKERITQRKKRSASGDIRVALVGYTNAGKSTLMNGFLERYYGEKPELSQKTVFEKDMLFATLDTTVRRIEPKGHQRFLLSDTVGFISNLPHNLVEAFHSTLEEAIESDVILNVIDFSDENYLKQQRVTEQTLEEIGTPDIPVIYVYNKADKCMDIDEIPRVEEDCIFMSAKQGLGYEELLNLIERVLEKNHKTGEFLIPYKDGGVVSYFKEYGVVKSMEYKEDGIYLTAVLRSQDYDKYSSYLLHS